MPAEVKNHFRWRGDKARQVNRWHAGFAVFVYHTGIIAITVPLVAMTHGKFMQRGFSPLSPGVIYHAL